MNPEPEAAERGTCGGPRIGSVPYLNAAPLTRGLGDGVLYLPPSQLATELHAGRVDAALLSITEVLARPGYEVLDGWGIASEGEVFSVFLAHRDPLDALGEVRVDPSSCTSVRLLQVLLAERGIRPEYVPLAAHDDAPGARNVLLIGNPAIAFRRAGHGHAIWDLGAAWREATGLPFVYAGWVLRAGLPDSAPLRARLREAAERGERELATLVAEGTGFDEAFRRAYLGGHIRYRLDARHWAGVARFADLMDRHLGIPARPVHRVR